MTEYSTTNAAGSLHPKSQAFDDFEADVQQAIENFQRLNANQKARYIDYLQKVFDDSAWAKHGVKRKGKNVPFNKENEGTDWPTVAQALVESEMKERMEALFDKMGFTAEARQQAADLFFEAVEQRLNHEDDAFRQSLADLLNGYSPSPFISNEEINAAELLASRIQELETALAYVQSENAQLVEEINQSLVEETASRPSHRSGKRSTVNDLMCEADEENSDALFNENNRGNSQMEQYLKAFGGE